MHAGGHAIFAVLTAGVPAPTQGRSPCRHSRPLSSLFPSWLGPRLPSATRVPSRPALSRKGDPPGAAARGRGPGPEGAETLKVPGSGRHEAVLRRPPGPKRLQAGSALLAGPRKVPRRSASRHSLGHGGGDGPGRSGQNRRAESARSGDRGGVPLLLRPPGSGRGLPAPTNREEGAELCHHAIGPSRRLLDHLRQTGPPTSGAGSGERRAHRWRRQREGAGSPGTGTSAPGERLWAPGQQAGRGAGISGGGVGGAWDRHREPSRGRPGLAQGAGRGAGTSGGVRGT